MKVNITHSERYPVYAFEDDGPLSDVEIPEALWIRYRNALTEFNAVQRILADLDPEDNGLITPQDFFGES